MIERPLYAGIWAELAGEKSMVFMAGPRQAGKTTLARQWAAERPNRVYFNWDEPGARARLVRTPTFFTEVARRDASPPLVVFDELHKYSRWKAYLKGAYDRYHEEYRFLVTGSGRLDLYQRGGDSLAGRYLLFHLWPFTMAELGRSVDVTEAGFWQNPARLAPDVMEHSRIWNRLLTASGFPDPYLTGKESSWRRWSAGYGMRVIREDIRDLTAVRTVQDMAVLYDLLPERVGSPLSLNALAEDLRVSHHTVQSWMDIFDRFYLTFRLQPWTQAVARSLQKERKAYLFDVPLVSEPAARLENAVALDLFAWIHRMNDRGWGPYGLFYVRDREKREVDFLVTRRRKPALLVEVKLSDPVPSAALRKFQAQWRIPAVQLLGVGDGYRMLAGTAAPILVAPAWQWLPGLP